jgi:hypothetical protein
MSAESWSNLNGGEATDRPESAYDSANEHHAVGNIDPRIAQAAALLKSVGEDIVNAKRGLLGVSATGLVGDLDSNLGALVRISQDAEAMYTVAGTRADADLESWQGMRTLLRANGKIHPKEVASTMHAGALVLEHPELAAAWVTGEVSTPQVKFIARTARRISWDKREDALALLIEFAPKLTMRELTHASRALLNAIIPGLEERDIDQAEDKVHFSLLPDGAGYLVRGWLTNEMGGWLQTVLDAHTSVVSSDDTRTRSERQAEALVTMARQYASSDVIPNLAMAKPKFVVLATLADLRAIADRQTPGDLPTTVFGDTLDPSTTRRLLSDSEIVPVLVDDDSPETLADVALDPQAAARLRARRRFFRKRRSRDPNTTGEIPMLLRLLTTPVRPLALGRSNRVVPGWLRDLITLRDAGCVVPGCETPAHRCEVHHVQPWALGGNTDVPNLAMLCIRHHRTVERGVWRLRPRLKIDGPGRYWVAEQC